MNREFFADYYEDLQVSSNADQETIERVYRMLAKRHHPDNRATGSPEKFDALTTAFRILSDPVKRAAYDAGYEELATRKWALSSPLSRSPRNGRDKEIRNNILSILYVERRNNPQDGSVGLWRMEKLLGWPETVLEFHVWYLKEKGFARRTDSGGYAITADGVDVIEESGIQANQTLQLPEKSEVPEETRVGFEKRGEEKAALRHAEVERERTPLKDRPSWTRASDTSPTST